MTVVCVLGMHRSGTSCLAGALQAAGLYAGEVVESAPFNPRGNRENLRIRNLNDAVLAASGGAWNQPPPALRWAGEHERERDAIVADFDRSADAWMFKDPRTVLTLDFWRAGVADLVPVGTFRHPAAVWGSLQQRALDSGDPQLRVDAGDAIRLWLHHNRVIADLRRQQVFPLLCFDRPAPEYLGDLGAAVAWVQTRIGDRCELRPEAAAGFFDQGLVRQGQGRGPASGPSPTADFGDHGELLQAAEELYLELSRMSRQEGCPSWGDR